VTLASQLLHVFPRQTKKGGTTRAVLSVQLGMKQRACEGREKQRTLIITRLFCDVVGKSQTCIRAEDFCLFVWSCFAGNSFVWVVVLFIVPTFSYPSAMDLDWEQTYSEK